jgi:DNA repair exonuclease SbcCD ATPase subunit
MLGVLGRVMGKAMPRVDRRIDWRLDRKLEDRVLPDLTKQTEAVAGLSSASEQLLFTMSELRRWMIDDLEAANETTVLLGESLTRLQNSIDRLEQQIGDLSGRLAAVETALGSRAATGSA